MVRIYQPRAGRINLECRYHHPVSPYNCGCTRDGGPLSAACVRQCLDWYRGLAQARGESWVRAVANVIAVDREWPDTERARDIARRKLGDVATDPHLVELLADHVLEGARRWWDGELARRRTRSD
jgi:hypothetical protein